MAVVISPLLADLDLATYARHALHDDDRAWPETNCYVDLWVELLHSLDLDPMAPLAFLLSTDFNGEQWEFFKYPLEDLRRLYGIAVNEFNVWRPIEDHITTHLRLGHLMTIEADSWFLPDTTGVSYRIGHQKTTIAPWMIDTSAKRLGYFHNRGCYELAGDDYVGSLRTGFDPSALAPYAEVIDMSRLSRPDEDTLRHSVDELVVQHLGRRPTSNPIDRLAGRVAADVDWLQASDDDTFHGYAFGTLRQCGAWADTLSTFVTWLGDPRLTDAADAFSQLSTSAKTCQFKLARLASGRQTDLGTLFATMASCWNDGYGPLVDAYGV